MSRRRNNGASIRGPTSALTDYLASHNISAQQINLDYQARVQAAQQQAAQAAAQGAAEDDKENDDSSSEDPAERKKRKRKEEAALKKIKASKEFKKRKFEHPKDNSDAESDDDALARSFLKESKTKAQAPPKPGQFANCEICEKRFTVTAYTIAGPEGGLLCTKCGKNVKDEKKKSNNAAKKKQVSKVRKRQTESDRMMGDVKPGAKSLAECCIKKVVDVVNDIDGFGDLPQGLLDRLSQILSKKRVINPRTLQLFLKSEVDRIAVYDCAKLESEDFQKIFAFMPDVERVNLRNAGQMKDEQLRYMIDKNSKIKHLQLGATNLISDPVWEELLSTRGSQLESLKLSELNDAFKDGMVQELSLQCTNLKRLKLRSCAHITGGSFDFFANMTSLEHLSLAVGQDVTSEQLTTLVTNLGPRLKTLCLEGYEDANNDVLIAIRENCTNLQKLRITGSATCTDNAFAHLFSDDWTNPPIPFIDLSTNRDIDGADPEPIPAAEDEEGGDDYVGFCSAALKAMFKHSGSLLERLDLHSCRHISHEALLEVFDGRKQYPALRDVDLSFVTHVDDVVMTGIFRSCPALQKLAVFACFSAKDALIPPNIAVVGLPNAQAAVEIIN